MFPRAGSWRFSAKVAKRRFDRSGDSSMVVAMQLFAGRHGPVNITATSLNLNIYRAFTFAIGTRSLARFGTNLIATFS